MRDNIVILEKRELDLDGEIINISYTISSPGEFDYLKIFKNYGEARQYIRDTYGI